MRVCDLCNIGSLEQVEVQVLFNLKNYDKEKEEWIIRGNHELTCEKEICIDCCSKLLKLFKKGGESK